MLGSITRNNHINQFGFTNGPLQQSKDLAWSLSQAKLLSQEEAEQVAQYVIKNQGILTSIRNIGSEDAPLKLGLDILTKMSFVAVQKRRTGLSVTEILASDQHRPSLKSGLNFTAGSCLNVNDQITAFKEAINSPTSLIEFGMALAKKDPKAIAGFLLDWQWKAHVTNSNQPQSQVVNPTMYYNYPQFPCPYPFYPSYAYPRS